MTRDELIDQVAEHIYLYDGGMTPDEYEEVTGKQKLPWKIRFNFQKECLDQGIRDEYRFAAERVVERLQYLKLIDFEVVKK